MEEKNPGEYFPVVEDESGSYMYNSKDLCTIEFIDRLIEAKVDSFKIEGRMKTSFYGASVTRVYRQAIDSYMTGHYQFKPEWLGQLEAVSHRGYTSGFYLGSLDKDSQNFTGQMLRSKDFVANVVSRNGRKVVLDIRGGKIKPGMLVEYLSREGIKPFVMPELRHADNGHLLEEANPGSKIEMETDLEFAPFEIIQKSVPVGTANSSENPSGASLEPSANSFESAEV
jgi:putative protease